MIGSSCPGSCPVQTPTPSLPSTDPSPGEGQNHSHRLFRLNARKRNTLFQVCVGSSSHRAISVHSRLLHLLNMGILIQSNLVWLEFFALVEQLVLRLNQTEVPTEKGLFFPHGPRAQGCLLENVLPACPRPGTISFTWWVSLLNYIAVRVLGWPICFLGFCWSHGPPKKPNPWDLGVERRPPLISHAPPFLTQGYCSVDKSQQAWVTQTCA